MPSLKDRDLNTTLDPAPASVGTLADKSAERQQTVALEVPVTVNGARALEGSDKREPFSESTKTVLVHAHGAVIRLSSAVAPGQLVFMTNEKTKKEVVCQVLKSKARINASGYVELQFTQPVSGFWGVRFPTESRVSRSDMFASASERDVWSDELSRAADEAKPTAPPLPERFKTDLKENSRVSSKADVLAPAEAPTQRELEPSRLREQLSALLSREESKPVSTTTQTTSGSDAKALSDTTAKLFEMAEAKSLGNAAPSAPESLPPRMAADATKGNAKPTKSGLSDPAKELPAEELKVPSWLEPLARNVASSSSSEEPIIAGNSAPQEAPNPQPQDKPAKPSPDKAKVVSARPVFGNTLLGHNTSVSARTQGNNRGLMISLAAGILVAAAGLTWYLRQPSETASVNAPVPAAAQTTTSSQSVAPASNEAARVEPNGAAGEVAMKPSEQSAANSQIKPASAPVQESSSSASVPAHITAQPAVITERVPKTTPSSESAPMARSSAVSNTDSPTEPEAAKPSLGKVRLRKPKVSHTGQAAGIAAPALSETDATSVPSGNPLAGGLSGSSLQPAAPAPPTPIGRNVKPAHLLSSLPPVYPAIAKSQHIAGDVRIDALIDASGRVSTMKVISGPPMLHQAAMDALRQWKYQAATLDGNPVATHLTVTVQFRLQ